MKISVDYKFGKTTHGVAVVTFKRFSTLKIFEKVITIGSQNGTFDVDISHNLGVSRDEQIDMILDYTDSSSDKKVSAVAYTLIKKLSAVLSIDASESFKSDQPYGFEVIAKDLKGHPVRFHSMV